MLELFPGRRDPPESYEQQPPNPLVEALHTAESDLMRSITASEKDPK